MNPLSPGPRLALRLAPALLLLAACGGESGSAGPASGVELQLTALRPLDPATEGRYAAWVYDAAGTPHALGAFSLPADGRVRLPLQVPDPRRLSVTIQPPAADASSPSREELLHGEFRGDVADLRIEGSLTQADLPIVAEPGAHSLFTTSNNLREGYPSEEASGLWFFRLDPENNPHGTREVHLTPLKQGWVYEGWIVHGSGGPAPLWISFGKFRPDQRQLLTSRDNTGSGPFSGDPDFRNGGVEDVPGDEWTTANPAFPLPAGVRLPIQLDSVDAAGHAAWSMVITIEPAFDEPEHIGTERPFLLQPYRNPIGAGPAWQPRIIEFQGNLPAGTARLVR